MQTQRLGRMAVSKVVEAEDGVPLPMIFPAIAAADLERVKRWCADPDLTVDPETSKQPSRQNSLELLCSLGRQRASASGIRMGVRLAH